MAFSSKVGSFALNTSTGNQSVTGVGFQPKALLFFSNSKTSDGNAQNIDFCQGIALSSSSRMVLAGFQTDAAVTADAQSYHNDAKCLLAINSVAAIVMAADLVTMDSDGFTINISTSDGVARIVNYIALGGSDLSSVFLKQWTTKTTTGTQAITGVGFKPDFILNIGSLATAAPPSTRTSIFHNIGFASSATSRANSSYKSGNGVGTTVTERTQETNKFLEQSNVSLFFVADFVSMDSDGFTINWSTANGTARYQYALCLKGGSYKIGAFNQSTSTGNQAVTGVGFTPSVVFFQSVNAATATGVQSNNRLSIGAATSSSARFNIWHGDTNGSIGVQSNIDLDRAVAVKMLTEGATTPTTNAAADFVSMDSDGFTINNTTTDATSREVLYFAIGVTTKTITGLARIQQAVTQTLAGLARIQKAVTQAITGTARITVSTLRTVTGVSRIQKSVLQTISGVSRITSTTLKTITGKSRIQNSATKTITGKGSIENSGMVNKNITGKAMIIQGAWEQSNPTTWYSKSAPTWQSGNSPNWFIRSRAQ